MALTNGMECQNFKWILTQRIVDIVIAIDIENDWREREPKSESGSRRPQQRDRVEKVSARWCGTQSDYQTNDEHFIIFTEKLPLLFRW